MEANFLHERYIEYLVKTSEAVFLSGLKAIFKHLSLQVFIYTQEKVDEGEKNGRTQNILDQPRDLLSILLFLTSLTSWS